MRRLAASDELYGGFWALVMMTRLIICLFVVALGVSCGNKVSAPASSAPVEAGRPVVNECLEKAWVLSGEWAGYMGIAIELSSNQYYYWFYSDVGYGEEPEYPLTGDYTFEGEVLSLQAGGHHLYSTEWVVTNHADQACLWATRDVGRNDRLLFPDEDFDAARPFRNQGRSAGGE